MNLSTNEIGQYLEDLNIPEETCCQCRQLTGNGQYEALYAELRRARTQVLADMHAAQSRLDCLDRLIYEIRKQG